MPEASILARDAFAAGWAQSTAKHAPLPLTDRARIALEAACRVAEASPQASAEPTLKLGQLEGIWAVIYARREAVEKLHGAALADVLDAIKQLDWAGIIDQAGRQLRLDPTLTRSELARVLGADVRNAIAHDLPADVAQAWRAAMNQALIDATAQGQTAALALIGDAAGVTIDWNLAATAAQQALAGSQVAWDASSHWIEQQVHGLGYQTSQKIAGMWADGEDPEDIRAAIMDLLDVSRSIAAVLLDTAIGQAISQGALNTYVQAGVGYADFITAGDARVCPDCSYAEDNNSYLVEECPQPPLHTGCRCCVAPADYQPTGAALALVGPYIDDTGSEDLAA